MDFLFYQIFFGIPVASIVLFFWNLKKYRTAKWHYDHGNTTREELKKRRILLNLSGVIALVLVAAVVGIIALLLTAVAFM